MPFQRRALLLFRRRPGKERPAEEPGAGRVNERNRARKIKRDSAEPAAGEERELQEFDGERAGERRPGKCRKEREGEEGGTRAGERVGTFVRGPRVPEPILPSYLNSNSKYRRGSLTYCLFRLRGAPPPHCRRERERASRAPRIR